MDLLDRIAAAATPTARIGAMAALVDRVGVAGREARELRELPASALASAEAGQDWRRDGPRTVVLCQGVADSVPLEGAALRSAAVRVLGGQG